MAQNACFHGPMTKFWSNVVALSVIWVPLLLTNPEKWRRQSANGIPFFFMFYFFLVLKLWCIYCCIRLDWIINIYAHTTTWMLMSYLGRHAYDKSKRVTRAEMENWDHIRPHGEHMTSILSTWSNLVGNRLVLMHALKKKRC